MGKGEEGKGSGEVERRKGRRGGRGGEEEGEGEGNRVRGDDASSCHVVALLRFYLQNFSVRQD